MARLKQYRRLAAGLLALLLAAASLALWPAAAPRRALLRAAGRTARTAATHRANAAEALGLGEVLALPGAGPAAQTLYLGTRAGPLAPALDGEVGLGVALRSDFPKGDLSADVSAQWGRVPVFWAYLQGRGEVASLRAPAIAMGSYGLRTTTLGADWNASALGRQSGVVMEEGLAFQLAKALWPGGEGGTPDELQTLAHGLAGQVQARRIGREDAAVGGETLRCTRYDVALTSEQMEAFAGEVAALLAADDTLNLLTALGAALPEGWPEWLNATTLADAVRQLLAGGLEGRVWLRRGRVARVELDLPVRLGGAEHAASLSLELPPEADGEGRLALAAGEAALALAWREGAPEGGRWQRQATLTLTENGDEVLALEIEASCLPVAAGGAFGLAAWCRAGQARWGLELAGTLAAEGDGLWAHLPDCAVYSGEARQPFTVEYQLAPLRGTGFEPIAPTMVLQLDEAGLERIADSLNTRMLERAGLAR